MPRGIYKRTKETRRNISKGHMGIVPWNKGKTNVYSSNTLKMMSLAARGHKSPMKGKHLSEKVKKKLSEGMKGRFIKEKNPFYGRKHTKETRERWSRIRTGRSLKEETKKKISKAMTGRKCSEEHLKNMGRRRIPSSLEIAFQKIIDKYSLPYKFVGDGQFILGHYNPDFINTNSEKIAIEVYARYHKLRRGISIEEWKEKRTRIFKEYGWSIIYFDETQVNENYVLEILKMKGEENDKGTFGSAASP